MLYTIKHSHALLVVLKIYLFFTAFGYLLAGKELLRGYVDELTVISVLSIALLHIFSYKVIPAEALKLSIVLLCFCFLGFWGALLNFDLSGYPVGVASIVELIIDAKFFIVAISVITVLSSSDTGEVEQWISSLCKTIVVLGLLHFALMIHDTITGTNLHGHRMMERAGRVVPLGLYDNKFKTAFFCVLAYIASLHLGYRKISVLLFISVLITLSVKEIFAATLVTALYFRKELRLDIFISVFLVLLVISIAIAVTDNPISSAVADRLSVFLFDPSVLTVRGQMYAKAPIIASEYFPFGSGAGTFGSSPSRDLYFSPLYYKYGIAYLHGGSEADGSFLIDTFWPKILGEYGWLGLFLYSLVFLRIIRIQGVSVFVACLNVAILVISLATPVYNYADGAIFGGVSAGLAIIQTAPLRSRRRNKHHVSLQGGMG